MKLYCMSVWIYKNIFFYFPSTSSTHPCEPENYYHVYTFVHLINRTFLFLSFFTHSCLPDDGPLNLLKELGPSAIDTELRNLAPDMGGNVDVLLAFLRLVSRMLDFRRDFDLTQAYLALFLKVGNVPKRTQTICSNYVVTVVTKWLWCIY